MNRRSSVGCPRCGRLVSLNSDRCIHCGLPRPGIFYKSPLIGDLISGKYDFINGITIACVLMYLLSLALDLTGTVVWGNIFSILSPSSKVLYRLGMGGSIPLLEGRWWTLITANYLHGGILHIAFNMFWLRRIGPWVVDLFGSSRMWVIYTVSGLVGALISALAGTPFYVGASGAIFGLFGALIYYGRYRGGTFGTGIFRQVLILAIISFVFGLAMPGVDNWGHLGGFTGGVIAGMFLGYEEKSPQRLWHHASAALMLIFVAVCFMIMVATFFLGNI